MADQNTGNVPQIDPDTLAKVMAVLAARNGGTQPSPNLSAMAENASSNPTAGILSQAMQSLNTTPYQPTPTGSGSIDPSIHPMLAKAIQTLANSAGAFGWTAMPPQERLERTQLGQQKAEAMARLAMQGQQLGLEQQRVGYEGERVGIERGRAAAEAKYQTGQLAESSRRTSIEQQRADQEHQYQTGMLDKSAKQLEEEIRFHDQQGTLEQNRINLEKGAQGLMKQRMQMEEDHFDQQIRMQGLTFNKQVAEDERKQLHESLDKYYQAHGWIGLFTGNDAILNQHQLIDQFIDDKLRQVTGPTPFPKPVAGQLEQPNAVNQVLSRITGSPPPQGAKPAYKVNGKWYDNPQGTGRPLQ